MQAALGKRELQLLGKLLIRDHPEIASNLYAVNCQPQPSQTDLTLIPYLFQQFCHMKGITENDLTTDNYPPGRRSGKESMYTKTLFVSVVLHLYKPEIFNQPRESIFIIGGLCATLTTVLGYRCSSSISKTIRDAVMYEKVYDDFRAEVERIVELLKEK